MWIVYALGAALFYAMATMFAKFSISKVVREQKGIVVIHAFAAMIAIIVIWMLRGAPGLASTKDVLLALVSGFLISFAAIFYFKAFHMEDASVVTLLTQITVPMTIVFGVIILRDKVGVLQLVASAMILAGVVVASWSRKGFHLHSTKIIPVIIIATALTTGVIIISKFVVGHNDTIAYTFYQTVGYFLFSALLTSVDKKTRAGFIKNVRPFHSKMLLVVLISEVFFTLAALSQFKGFQHANAGLVISVRASEVFLSILLGLVLTKLMPHRINEKIDKKTIGRKFIAGVLVVSGIVMLNFV